MVQSVELLTLDLSSGLDLRVVSSNPALGSTLGVEPNAGLELMTLRSRPELRSRARCLTN